MTRFTKKVTFWGKSFTLTPNHLILLLILVIATYLRFANFPLKYGFDFDPTRDALIIAEGAKNLHFPLIGPKSGIGPFSFGPWYYYELILFKLILPVSYSPWIFIGLMSLGFVIVMYFIGKELEGEKFGLLLALIAAFSPEQIGPTTGLSNPNLVPIHAALTVLLSIVYIKKKTLRWFWVLLWGLIVGVGINHHYQMLLLLPLPFLSFVYKRNKRAVLDSILFVVGIAISFIPLLIFNFHHHFETITGFFYFVTKGGQTSYIPNRWLFYVRDFWGKFLSMTFGISLLPTVFLLLITIGAFVWAFIQKRISVLYMLMLITFAIDFVFLRYFIVQRELYYFLFIHPFLFIFLGFGLGQITKIKFGNILVALILLAMLPSVWQQDMLRINARGDQIAFHTEAQKLEQTLPGKQITLFGCEKNNMNRPQGVAFFLLNDNKLTSNGVPVALLDTGCSKDSLTNATVTFSQLDNTAVEISSNTSPKTLQQLGITLVSPLTVFNRMQNQ